MAMTHQVRGIGRHLLRLTVLIAILVALAVPTAAAAQGNNSEGCFCGGIAGFPCPEGYICVDDPNDSCDPDAGGVDCGGICVLASPSLRACDGLANAQSKASPNGQAGIDQAQDATGCEGDDGGGSDDDGGGGGI